MVEPELPGDVFGAIGAPESFESVVAQLGDAISVGRLAPGTRLPPERELAPLLGVSRWTLRKAVTTLTQTGHLESRKGRSGGNFVAVRPPLRPSGPAALRTDHREVLDLRKVLEVGSIALASQRAEATQIEQLEQLVEDMEGVEEWDEYRRADVRFHVTIAEATQARRVIAETTVLQAELSVLLGAIAHPPLVLAHANEEHRAMVDGIRDRDAETCIRLMQRHLAGTEQIVATL